MADDRFRAWIMNLSTWREARWVLCVITTARIMGFGRTLEFSEYPAKAFVNIIFPLRYACKNCLLDLDFLECSCKGRC